MGIGHIEQTNLAAARQVASCDPVSSALPGYVMKMADEIEEMRRVLGGGCDANYGGQHVVMKEAGTEYRFCANCGETLSARVTRFVHK